MKTQLAKQIQNQINTLSIAANDGSRWINIDEPGLYVDIEYVIEVENEEYEPETNAYDCKLTLYPNPLNSTILIHDSHLCDSDIEEIAHKALEGTEYC